MMFNDCEFFLVLYVLKDGNPDLVHMVGFDEAPTVKETHAELSAVVHDGIVGVDFDQCYMALLNRDSAMALFGL